MSKIKTIDGDLVARDLRVAIVAARFNELVVERLLDGAVTTLKRLGASDRDLTVVHVPGAFDIPLVVKKLAAGRRFDAIIALGAVIRGATAHFDYVAGECAGGLSRIALEHEVPVVFGVLTTDTIEQALERAGTKAGNKGSDAAQAAVELANVMRRIDG
ncbi:MAG: 6,7-dimethyl-8-ribityllumazine synthase [Pseudomonadota bacterium]